MAAMSRSKQSPLEGAELSVELAEGAEARLLNVGCSGKDSRACLLLIHFQWSKAYSGRFLNDLHLETK